MRTDVQCCNMQPHQVRGHALQQWLALPELGYADRCMAESLGSELHLGATP